MPEVYGSASSVAQKAPKCLVPVQAGDQIRMKVGPYAGRRAFIEETFIPNACEGAMRVYIWELDRSIITVRSHFVRHRGSWKVVA